MKKFFAFAMAIVAMATSMVSCNNDDNTDFIEQKAPEAQASTQPGDETVEFDGYIYFTATPAQLEIFNNIFIVNIGDESFEVNVEKLEETSFKPEKQASKIDSYRAEFGEQSLKVFRFKVPVVIKDLTDVTVNANFSLKEGVQVPENFIAFIAVNDKIGMGAFGETKPLSSDKASVYVSFVNRLTYNFNTLM